MNSFIKRGDIYLADLSPVTGSEQGGLRPVLVIQNDIGNRYSPTVIVAAITGQFHKAKLKTHVEITKDKYNIEKDSVVLLEQIRTVDKDRLDYYKIASLDKTDMMKVNTALMISTGVIDLANQELLVTT
ncbi:type II toxin-antitoxin system PemK/MazF family toxin [Paenibacillus xylaniclasticus]|uniref:type II toxin-antitoxin system PemK/MazF family toxin n=1 Tax=Paenibacillus xylaniclasticus TaxID=588083 RepID=UPI000FD94A32|nr:MULTISPECIES: type II toxin-antitoxin system PemK/MazF family toxin [Paenibacillus]GFN32537.1 mRNA interferase [Paenibacillus curdlanolyticus]